MKEFSLEIIVIIVIITDHNMRHPLCCEVDEGWEERIVIKLTGETARNGTRDL
jgi:hypothetical protein